MFNTPQKYLDCNPNHKHFMVHKEDLEEWAKVMAEVRRITEPWSHTACLGFPLPKAAGNDFLKIVELVHPAPPAPPAGEDERLAKMAMQWQRESLQAQPAGEQGQEPLLDARIMLDSVVKHPEEGWQGRYCEAIDRVAEHHKVSSGDLAGAWLRHNQPAPPPAPASQPVEDKKEKPMPGFADELSYEEEKEMDEDAEKFRLEEAEFQHCLAFLRAAWPYVHSSEEWLRGFYKKNKSSIIQSAITAATADQQAEIARLKAEVKQWRPMTPEEAEEELAKCEAVPITNERLDEILAEVFRRDNDPTYMPDEFLHVRLLQKIRRIEAENAELKAKLAGLEGLEKVARDLCDDDESDNFSPSNTLRCWEKLKAALPTK